MSEEAFDEECGERAPAESSISMGDGETPEITWTDGTDPVTHLQVESVNQNDWSTTAGWYIDCEGGVSPSVTLGQVPSACTSRVQITEGDDGTELEIPELTAIDPTGYHQIYLRVDWTARLSNSVYSCGSRLEIDP